MYHKIQKIHYTEEDNCLNTIEEQYGRNSGESGARDIQNQAKCIYKQLMFKNNTEKQWENMIFDYCILSVYFWVGTSGKDESSSDFSSSEEESGSRSDIIKESRDISSTNSSWRTFFARAARYTEIFKCIFLWTCGVSSNSSSESSLGTFSIFGFNSHRESNVLCTNKLLCYLSRKWHQFTERTTIGLESLDLFSLNQQNIINKWKGNIQNILTYYNKRIDLFSKLLANVKAATFRSEYALHWRR